MIVAGFKAATTTAACEQCAASKRCMLCGLFSAQEESEQQFAVRSEELKRGDTLFTTGQTFKQLYVIRSGSIKTSVTGSDGDSQITGFHLQGAMLGLDGIEGGEYTHCAQALESCKLCSISFTDFSVRVASTPQLLQMLLHRISRDIKQGNKMIFMLGKCNAQQRVARFLFDLSDRYRSSGKSAKYLSLTMSRHDIASYLGLASETASRVLQRFQSMGLITVERRNITLKNTTQLRHIANDRSLRRELVGLAS
ncbi:MAG: helix-turn-helix domain-containing protein [Pseudomonadales bacterium]